MDAKFEIDFETNVHMTDADGVCRASEVLRLMQEAANRQLEVRGPTMAQLRAQGRAFLLSRISMEILRPIRAYERLRASSWPSVTSRGMCFDRSYALRDQNGVPAAYAMSQWALLDINEHRLLRCEESGVDYAHEEAVDISIPLRLRIPKTVELAEVGRHEILYADADKNRHMNNTHYPDVYCDRLPMEGMYVSAMSITFLKEAPLGDTMLVQRSAAPDADGIYWFRTLRSSDGAVNTEAAVRLSRLV